MYDQRSNLMEEIMTLKLEQLCVIGLLYEKSL